jgi:hypothetical protein
VLGDPPTYTVAELEPKAHHLLHDQVGPILSIPVDVELLLERMPGVDLDYWPGIRENHGLDGLVMRDSATGELFVMIDEWLANNQPTRYRMTVAEELGHLVLHREFIDHIVSVHDFQELQQHNHWHSMERNAKRFAAALLMPPDDITKRAEQLYPQLVQAVGFDNPAAIVGQLAITLARNFGVSKRTMEIRLGEWPVRVRDRVQEAIRGRVDFLP